MSARERAEIHGWRGGTKMITRTQGTLHTISFGRVVSYRVSPGGTSTHSARAPRLRPPAQPSLPGSAMDPITAVTDERSIAPSSSNSIHDEKEKIDLEKTRT